MGPVPYCRQGGVPEGWVLELEPSRFGGWGLVVSPRNLKQATFTSLGAGVVVGWVGHGQFPGTKGKRPQACTGPTIITWVKRPIKPLDYPR